MSIVKHKRGSSPEVSARRDAELKALAEKPEADPAADKFEVKLNGEAVAVSAVEKKASDLTGKTYRLTVASLANKEGTLSVNGTEKKVEKIIEKLT